MPNAIASDCMNQIFLEARTQNAWHARDVPDDVLRKLVDVAKMGPTSANCSPMRLILVKSKAGKEKLKPFLSPGNVEKTMAAPVTAIIGYDMEFHEHLPKLFPHADAKSWFDGKPEYRRANAIRNGTLQGAYLIIAARALGLDTGPMSGFDADGTTKAFFAGTSVKADFLCNLGYGDPAALFPRSPRFDFEEMAEIV